MSELAEDKKTCRFCEKEAVYYMWNDEELIPLCFKCGEKMKKQASKIATRRKKVQPDKDNARIW